MFQFIQRFVRKFQKEKPVGPSHWTPEETKAFDDMIEGFETLECLTGSMIEQRIKVASGRTITFRPLNPEGVIKPAICPDFDKVYKWEVPLGIFHIDGRWEHNPLLSINAAEQRKHNESLGFLPSTKQSTAWPDAKLQNGLAES